MEAKKKCKRCCTVRAISKFRRMPPKTMASGKVKRYISNICTPCIVARNKETRHKDQKEYNKEARERRNSRKRRAIEYKGGKCEQCKGVFHTAAYDFHHTVPSEKKTDPGLMMGLTDGNLFKELDKCVLLCSNCHRILHYEETNT